MAEVLWNSPTSIARRAFNAFVRAAVSDPQAAQRLVQLSEGGKFSAIAAQYAAIYSEIALLAGILTEAASDGWVARQLLLRYESVLRGFDLSGPLAGAHVCTADLMHFYASTALYFEMEPAFTSITSEPFKLRDIFEKQPLGEFMKEQITKEEFTTWEAAIEEIKEEASGKPHPKSEEQFESADSKVDAVAGCLSRVKSEPDVSMRNGTLAERSQCGPADVSMQEGVMY